MAPNETPTVKKVRAFPIPVTLTFGATPPVAAKIVKLTEQGFLAETTEGSLKPGERGQAQFEIPVAHDLIQEHCIIIKHYSHWVAKDGGQVPGFLIEAHFQNLSDAGGKKIRAFLASLRRET